MSRIKELRALFDKQLDALEYQALALEAQLTGQPVGLLCSRNERPPKALAGRAQSCVCKRETVLGTISRCERGNDSSRSL